MDKAQIMITDIKNEMHQNLSQNKHTQMSLEKELDQDVKKLSMDVNNLQNQSYQDINSLQDKLQRLAAQFDKELVSRDKQLKQFKT